MHIKNQYAIYGQRSTDHLIGFCLTLARVANPVRRELVKAIATVPDYLERAVLCHTGIVAGTLLGPNA